MTGDNFGKILALLRMFCGSGDFKFPNSRIYENVISCKSLPYNIDKKCKDGSLVVGLDLSSIVFSNDQLYSGLSRVTNPDKLKESLLPDSDSQTNNLLYLKALA